jgi:predicted dehydrogenase
MKKLGFVLIGAGYIAHYHARAILAHKQAEIIAVCGLEEKILQQFAKKYSISKITTGVFDLIHRHDVDAAVISTPNKFHAPLAIEFLKNGKDVFIEKPMAMNVWEGEEVKKIARENNRLVCVGHMWRFDTEVNYIKRVVGSGKIGKVFKTKGYGIHENWGPSGWFTQKEFAGGGALADMGVHAIDTVRYILGDVQPKEVYAKIATYFGDYEVDDSGILLITWSDDTVSIIESGWMHPHSDGPEAATRLFGTKGYASVFPTKIKTDRGGCPGEYLPLFPERSEHCDQIIYTRQMAHFIDSIKKRIEPKPGLKEGITVLNIVDAAYKSAKTGKVIPVVQ